MNTVVAIRQYFEQAISQIQGPKALLLDEETTVILSLVLTQSQLLEKDIYLIDKIRTSRNNDRVSRLLGSNSLTVLSPSGTNDFTKSMHLLAADHAQSSVEGQLKHLKCIVFIRPTFQNIQDVIDELKDPLFGEYHLFFSNSLKKSDVETLAEGDEYELVKEVHEYYADYYALDETLFSSNLIPPKYTLYSTSSTASSESYGYDTWQPESFERSIDAISALLLSIKKKPVVRYSSNSNVSRQLAKELVYKMHQQESSLFDVRKPDVNPILFIFDRKNDPVTPLLMEWTYQAMLHELLGIKNGRIRLEGIIKDSRPELREVVLNPDQDDFYKENMYINIGDLGENVKKYVEEYQKKHKTSSKVESIEEMRRFVEDYPAFKKLSGNVTKNVALVGEISKIVDKLHLMELSELEQNLSVTENHNNDVISIKEFLKQSDISNFSKIKLISLYALRYESSPNNCLNELLNIFENNFSMSTYSILSDPIISNKDKIGSTVLECLKLTYNEKLKTFISSLLKYAGNKKRQGDLFNNNSVFSRTKNVLKGLKSVENVYTQHTPIFVTIVEDFIRGNTTYNDYYPIMDLSTSGISSSNNKSQNNMFNTNNGLNNSNNPNIKPQEIIIYIIGGITYGESREFLKLMELHPHIKIVSGGSRILNSSDFVENILLSDENGSLEEIRMTRNRPKNNVSLATNFNF